MTKVIKLHDDDYNALLEAKRNLINRGIQNLPEHLEEYISKDVLKRGLTFAVLAKLGAEAILYCLEHSGR